MPVNIIDVIEAFADGEAVDPAALKAALAEPAGRDHLVDVLTLRALVGDDAVARPSVLPAATNPPTPRGAWARRIPLAAGIALIGGITGYVAGLHSTAAPAQVSKGVVVSSAPTPTQVFHLRDGVDWTEKAGGN